MKTFFPLYYTFIVHLSLNEICLYMIGQNISEYLWSWWRFMYMQQSWSWRWLLCFIMKWIFPDPYMRLFTKLFARDLKLSWSQSLYYAAALHQSLVFSPLLDSLTLLEENSGDTSHLRAQYSWIRLFAVYFNEERVQTFVRQTQLLFGDIWGFFYGISLFSCEAACCPVSCCSCGQPLCL